MFRCKDIAEHASRYVDRKLSFVERVQFRVHLFICHDCRHFIAQFRLSLASLRNFKQRPGDDVVAKQVAALQAARDQLQSPSPPKT